MTFMQFEFNIKILNELKLFNMISHSLQLPQYYQIEFLFIKSKKANKSNKQKTKKKCETIELVWQFLFPTLQMATYLQNSKQNM